MTLGHVILRGKANAAMHVFARRCLRISQAETYRRVRKKIKKQAHLSGFSTPIILRLNDFSTITMKIRGLAWGAGGAATGSEFPSASPRARDLPCHRGHRRVFAPAFPLPGFSAQRSNDRESLEARLLQSRRGQLSLVGYEWPHYSRLLFHTRHARRRAFQR